MAFYYRKTQKLARFQFMATREGRFTLCRHDEYGISDVKKRVMLKKTYVYRELMLRLRARKITAEYYSLKQRGLFSWAAYQEHRESIQNSFAFLRRALARYTARRIEAGFFYMYAHPHEHSVYVMSPLHTMPRKEALKKVKRLRRRRQHYAARASSIAITSPSSVQGSNFFALGNIGERSRLIQIFSLYSFVIILAWMIVYL
ncbi:hypothetical protein GQ55_7G332000 [Panicum hallii var. hallii]|uniref:Uncharacterized protein n=2 Tax=Panicum hallii var. hallii TaxID=1504633 RepID=A0A2T7D1W6_9POAL|nr:hypothetical protein GQ55_7G332000 [Panicum hallii var. hallii]